MEYDPLVHEEFDTAHAVFADLRARCPVARSEAFGGFWIATRYADIRAMLDDPLEYTTTVRNVVPGASATGRRPPLHLDPPEHTPYRRAIDRALGPARVAATEPVIREHVARLLDGYVAKGGGDFVEDFGSPLPALLFADWFQLAPEQTELLWRTAQAFVKAWEAFDVAAVSRTSDVLYDLARALIAERRDHPLDPSSDPVSSLLDARDDADHSLPDEMLVGCVRQILVVGLVAPPVFLGSVAVHLARDPALQEFLRGNPQHDVAAVEEFLRLYTPYRGFARTSRSGTALGGRDIRPGEPIALAYASANRDEAVFADPDRFILNRPNVRDHLAFGRGPHRCAGMSMARAEFRIALRGLLDRTRTIELAGTVRMSGMPEVGPVYVPLRVTAA
ncbi:Cytochrome P450 [Sphingomonas guangdongensis]|uniref:Cytochrome P450 n=1 Tax=Sphingomonas guangdongensis TaxID=1141890 RepID=A0A285R795_9SPHN|nr:cytochrome P450 [Sphingomonas guangdongensis]SOB88252.1 Cytochrome P450 [Sphingomonas guangdongensis]